MAGDHVAEHAGIWGYKDDGLARLPKVESPGHGEVLYQPTECQKALFGAGGVWYPVS